MIELHGVGFVGWGPIGLTLAFRILFASYASRLYRHIFFFLAFRNDGFLAGFIFGQISLAVREKENIWDTAFSAKVCCSRVADGKSGVTPVKQISGGISVSVRGCANAKKDDRRSFLLNKSALFSLAVATSVWPTVSRGDADKNEIAVSTQSGPMELPGKSVTSNSQIVAASTIF